MIVAIALAALVALTFVNPWVFTADDSLFYLVVARHVVADGAVSFNGLLPTNGVQPLWQTLTAGVIGATELLELDSAAAQLRSVFLLNWLLAFVALAQMWRLLGRLGVADPFRMVGVVVLASCLCGPWAMFASEAHLVAATMLWLLLSLERWCRDGPSPRLVTAVGCAAGLMMLSRLDSVWVAVTAFTVLLVVGARRDHDNQRKLTKRIWPALAAGGLASLLVLPYLVWNLVSFGHLTPVSGAIKVDVNQPRFSLDGIGTFGVAVLGVVWIGGVIGVLRTPRHRRRLAVWFVPAVGATVSSLFYFAFSRGPFTQWFWYYVPHAVALAVTGAFASLRLASDLWRRTLLLVRAAQVGCAVLAVVAVLFCAARYVTGPPNRLWTEARTFSAEIAEATPPGTAVASVDMPGVLAFVSERPVVALDGLVGDFEFQDRWRDDGGSCTLARLEVEHLVTVDDIAVTERDQSSITLEFSSWLHREAPSELRGSGPLLEFPKGRYQLWDLDDTCRSGR